MYFINIVSRFVRLTNRRIFIRAFYVIIIYCSFLMIANTISAKSIIPIGSLPSAKMFVYVRTTIKIILIHTISVNDL